MLTVLVKKVITVLLKTVVTESSKRVITGETQVVITERPKRVIDISTIAAALFYEQPSDPIAMQLKNLREQQGIDYILENICSLDKEADKQLISLIKEKIEMLRERGWVG